MRMPNDINAEKGIIGIVLNYENAIDDIIDTLHAEMFYNFKTRLSYESILKLYKENIKIDITTLCDQITRDGNILKVDQFYLMEISENEITSAMTKEYVDIIINKWQLRETILLCKKTSHEAQKEEQLSDYYLNYIGSNIERISIKSSLELTDISCALHEFTDHIDRVHSGEIVAYKTGLHTLDEYLRIENGDYVIIAGRPSCGKTSLMIQIARYFSIVKEMPSLIFSLETNRKRLAGRILAQQAEVNLVKLYKMSSLEYSKAAQAMGLISESPIKIDDARGIDINYVRARARYAKRKYDIKLICIDYLQLMSGTGNNREAEISGISRGLQSLAGELNIPILVLSQLNRASETEKRHPRLSDLRESGAIEQDAQSVVFVHFRNIEDKEDPVIIIGKQKDGPVKTIEVDFIKDYAVFKDRNFNIF